MSNKLYDDKLAEAIKASGDTHYRPSNGTEGEMFRERWCEQCKRDAAFRDGSGNGCEILTNSLIRDVDDPAYPPEWTYDEGQPCCTAFEAVDAARGAP